MQHHSADQLDVEMHHVPGDRLVADEPSFAAEPAGGVAHHGKRLGQNFIEDDGALREIVHRGEPLFPSKGFRAQIVVRQCFKLRVQLVDSSNNRKQPPQFALVPGAENPLKNPVKNEHKGRRISAHSHQKTSEQAVPTARCLMDAEPFGRNQDTGGAQHLGVRMAFAAMRKPLEIAVANPAICFQA